jgi:hypothetical protein
MDIYVRIPLKKRKSLSKMGGRAKAFAEEAKHLTIVFDPPQNNGNGNGP